MKRWANAIMLAGILMAPVAIHADDKHRDRDDHRVYDSYRKDYHEWNENEDRAWRHYLEQNHRHYKDWKKAAKRDQRNYWEWRHSNPDWDRH